MSTDSTNRQSSQHPPLNFDASVGEIAAACSVCGVPLRGSYHMINDAMACAKCRYAAEERVQVGTSATGLLLATVYGIGAAIVGAAGYYAFTQLTGIEWALLTGLVGLGVGKAVSMGGKGHGGTRYQLVALALTWCAMGGAYLPLMYGASVDAATSARTQITARAQATIDSITEAHASGETLDSASQAAIDLAQKRAKTARDFTVPTRAKIVLLLIGLFTAPIVATIASPISGLFIGYALYRAWKFNGAGGGGGGGAPVNVSCPFRLQPAPPAP